MNKLLVPHPPVIAHRGASAYAPENTLAAFRKAKALGATWIEFDVMLAACGEVVVFHDETLERTTNGRGKLSDYCYDDLKTLDAGSWFHPQFAAEKIPSLKEVLLFLEQVPLCANIELKPLPGQEQALVQQVLSLVNHHWPKHITPPLFSSFSIEAMRELRKQSPASLLGLLMDRFLVDGEKIVQTLDCVTVHINQDVINPENLARLKTLAKPIFCYTVNDASRAAELFSWGVDAVFSDCPDKIIS